MLKSLGKNGKDGQQDVDDSFRPTVGVVRKSVQQIIRHPGWLGSKFPLAQLDPVNDFKGPYAGATSGPASPFASQWFSARSTSRPFCSTYPGAREQSPSAAQGSLRFQWDCLSGTTRMSQRFTQAHIDKCTAANPSGVYSNSKARAASAPNLPIPTSPAQRSLALGEALHPRAQSDLYFSTDLRRLGPCVRTI
ncbi:MAG: hypothetical protein Q9198_000102 [Flavoplaca austrocitrina]